MNRWPAESQEPGPLVHVHRISVPFHGKEVTGLPFTPGDRQRDFPVDLYKAMLSKQDTRQLFGKRHCLKYIPNHSVGVGSAKNKT